MSAAKTPAKVGDHLEVPNPAEVTLPSGDVIRVTGGLYIAEQDGPHAVKKG
jgi:hypothetical protein